MSKEGITVCIRARPFIEREIRAGDDKLGTDNWIVDSHSNTIQATEAKRPFNFDRVYDQLNTNEDVYSETALPIVKSALLGVNGTILAYGQTSSGKTFTMSSLMKQSFEYIFDHIENDTKRQYFVKAGYCEVYNEAITDLASQTTNLAVTDTGAIRGLTIRDIPSATELLAFHGEGTKNRKVGATKMNSESSRSHSIFQVYIESTPRDDGPKSSLPTAKKEAVGGKLMATINFVDLAGSERASQTEASGDRLKEGAQINTSLLVLGRVIRALTRGENPPYRESKLTRILRPSLGGNCRTTLICCITLAKKNTSETSSTLGFAYAAKQVVNTVGVNEVLDDRQMVARLRETMNVYRAHFSKAHDFVADLHRRGITITPEMMTALLQLLNIPATTAIGTLLSAPTPAPGGAGKKFPTAGGAGASRESTMPGATNNASARSAANAQSRATTAASKATPNDATGIDLTDLERQQQELESDFLDVNVPGVGKKPKLIIDTTLNSNKLVQLASGEYAPSVNTVIQTDFSVLKSLVTKDGTDNDANNNKLKPRKSKKRKSMSGATPSADDMNDSDVDNNNGDDEEEDSEIDVYYLKGQGSSSSNVKFYTEPRVYYANLTHVAELLGFSAVGVDDLLGEYIPQDEATLQGLEESINTMLKSHGFDDVRQYLDQIQGHQDEISLLQNEINGLRSDLKKTELILQEQLTEQKNQYEQQLNEKNAMIEQLESELDNKRHLDSDRYHEQKLELDELDIKYNSLRQENDILQMQLTNVNNKHTDALKFQQQQFEQQQQILLNEITLHKKTIEYNKAEYDKTIEDYEKMLDEVNDELQNKLKLLEDEHEEELKDIQERTNVAKKKAEEIYESRYQQFRQQRDELVNELQQLEKHFAEEEEYYQEELKRAKEEYQAKVDSAVNKAEILKDKLTEAQLQINELQRENDRQAIRIQTLSEAQEKELQQNSTRLKAISGDKDKLIQTLEGQLNVLKSAAVDQRVAFDAIQSRLTSTENDLIQERKLHANIIDQLKKKSDAYDALKKRMDEWVTKQREDRDLTVKKATAALIQERDRYKAKVDEKDQYIKHLKELQVTFKEKVSEKLRSKAEETEELQKLLRQREKELTRLTNETETRYIKIQQYEKDLITYKSEIRNHVELIEKLRIDLQDAQGREKFHANEVVALRTKLSTTDGKYGQYLAEQEKQRQKENRDFFQQRQVLMQEKINAEKTAAMWKQQQQEAMNKWSELMQRCNDLEQTNKAYQERLNQMTLQQPNNNLMGSNNNMMMRGNNTGLENNIYGSSSSGSGYSSSIPTHLLREQMQETNSNNGNIYSSSSSSSGLQTTPAFEMSAKAQSSPYKRFTPATSSSTNNMMNDVGSVSTGPSVVKFVGGSMASRRAGARGTTATTRTRTARGGDE